ncbi:hypothetical protein AB5J56_28270 [Streptomyces sp. R21]|jgi:hypothetical protein|uniref:Uncharacterized protein n=1 Tax=Streptomyces sp. R21 TaxID=3238627 RepID=A0AB39PE03_9ACTN
MNDSSKPSRTAGKVRPWVSLASLGVTESDLTTVHHRPVIPFRRPGERPGERHRHISEGA